MLAEHPCVRNMAPALMAAEELLHTSIPYKRVDLVRGVLVVREPPGLRHGRVAVELSRLADHVATRALGRVYVESGFTRASVYSTRGGTVGYARRSTRPFRSSERSVCVNCFCVMPPISRLSC